MNESLVLQVLAAQPDLSAAKIAAKIGVSKPTVEHVLSSLKKKAVIRREGSTRGKWIILKPVWSAKHGWMLVNAISQKLICPNGNMISFSDIDELFIAQAPFAAPTLPQGQPLSRLELHEQREIWLEPISCDTHLRDELRGWYRIKSRWAENEYGNRFYLDVYGAKWLAFDKKL